MVKKALDMKRLILVCTGTKFSEWFVDNIFYMIDKYSGLKFDERCVVREEKFEGPLNKLQIFDLFRTGQNLYFDLDTVIKGPISETIFKKDFTLINALWRPSYFTPLNSSIMSWTGDASYIYKKYMVYPEYYKFKYGVNDDWFIYKECKYSVYDPAVCYSYLWGPDKKENLNHNICLFNQSKDIMENHDGWWKKYTLSKST